MRPTRSSGHNSTLTRSCRRRSSRPGASGEHRTAGRRRGRFGDSFRTMPVLAMGDALAGWGCRASLGTSARRGCWFGGSFGDSFGAVPVITMRNALPGRRCLSRRGASAGRGCRPRDAFRVVPVAAVGNTLARSLQGASCAVVAWRCGRFWDSVPRGSANGRRGGYARPVAPLGLVPGYRWREWLARQRPTDSASGLRVVRKWRYCWFLDHNRRLPEGLSSQVRLESSTNGPRAGYTPGAVVSVDECPRPE